MDFQRIAILLAIAAVSFMLLTEWVNFQERYRDIEDAQIVASRAAASAEPTADENTNDLIPSEADASNGDIPVIQSTENPRDIPELLSEKIITVSSDVLEIHIDPRGGDIVHLALLQHKNRIDSDEPFVLLENERRTYIAQSGLVGKNGTDTSEGKPLFSSEASSYTLKENEEQIQVDLVWQQSQGVNIIKRYTLRRSDYLIDVEYLIKNASNESWQAIFYGQIKRDNSSDPTSDTGMMGMQPFLGIATATAEERFYKMDFDEIKEENLDVTRADGWIAMIQHYFLSAWVPAKNIDYRYTAIVTRSGFNIARFTGPQWQIPASSEDSVKAQFYAGPKDQYRLAQIADGLDLSVDYSWLWWLAQPLYALLFFFNNGVLHMFGWSGEIFGGFSNWGFSIIMLTILVKAAFFNLNATAYKSMAKMRQFQPKMMALRERYPDDRQKQSQEMMELYKKEGVNPLGGCLPMLVQMPVFIALYWVLLESVELRHAPFIGYIQDLSAIDPYFILPLIMGASMFFQQKLNPPPPDPMQAKIMQWMPVIFTFFFLFFPSGLVLYWVVNNLLSIAQQYVITRQIEAAAK